MKKLLLLLAAVVCISTTASAQDKGDWAIMPRINIYTAWDADTVFGIGAAARYNVLDQLRLEPALTLLCHDGCSIDLNCDVTTCSPWPTVGISIRWRVSASMISATGRPASTSVQGSTMR